jgi:hypothetical protein
MFLLAAASDALSTFPQQVWVGGTFCVPGFCPAVVRYGPPSGLMFLAVGLVAVGLYGLLRKRITR